MVDIPQYALESPEGLLIFSTVHIIHIDFITMSEARIQGTMYSKETINLY